MLRLLCTLSLVLWSVASAPAAAPHTPSVRETLDLRYHPGRARQVLDIYAPTTTVKAPVVIFVHGGSWVFGDKDFFGLHRKMGRFLAREGVVAVMINYRLSPSVKHPEHAKDVARAYAWVVRNISKFGGDPERIILAGHSAGAHLASLVATDDSYLRDPTLKLTPKERESLRGVVSICGVYRIPAEEEFNKMALEIVTHLVGEATQSKVAGFMHPTLMWASKRVNPFPLVFGTDRGIATNASPSSHIRPGLPAFLLLNSEAEIPGLTAMAEDFSDRLKKNGTAVEWKVIDGVTHRTIVREFHGSTPTSKLVLDFVRKNATLDRTKK